MKTTLFRVLLLLSLTACTPAKPSPTAVSSTPELDPTVTPTLTRLPASPTSLPSQTPRPTWTPTSTPTPQVIPTLLAFTDILNGGDLAISTTYSDGSQLTRLTKEGMSVSNPVWSPDGRKIAFMGCLGGNLGMDCPEDEPYDIYTVHADGTGLTNLTRKSVRGRYPSWSPDGRIAFSSLASGKEQIYIMNGDGTGVKQVTDGKTSDQGPYWAPDLKWLAYSCAQYDPFAPPDFSTCVLPVDGSTPAIQVGGLNPVWSPAQAEGGARLAIQCASGQHNDICLVNPDGSGLVNLTNSPWDEISPTWSPDGKWIAYQSNANGDIAIYKVCVVCESSREPVQLTNAEETANRPAWSPDGRQIAFLYGNNFDLFIMWADGSGQRLLAEDILGAPAWAPTLPQARTYTLDPDHNEILFSIPVGENGITYKGGGFENPPWGPSALIADRDGSFWILDNAGRQVLQFSRQGEKIAQIKLPPSVVGGADMAFASYGMVILDDASEPPRIIVLTAQGVLSASYDLPRNYRPADGIDGITLAENGDLLLTGPGAYITPFLDAAGKPYAVLKTTPLVRAALPTQIQGTPLGFGPDGDFYVMVKETAQGPTLQVDETARHYAANGNLLGMARVPVASQYVYVAHNLVLAEDGSVYALSTHADRVDVLRLIFAPELKPVLTKLPATPTRTVSPVPEVTPSAKQGLLSPEDKEILRTGG